MEIKYFHYMGVNDILRVRICTPFKVGVHVCNFNGVLLLLAADIVNINTCM